MKVPRPDYLNRSTATLLQRNDYQIMQANQDKNSYIWIYAAIWLALVFTGLIVGIFVTDGVKHYRLKTKGIEIQGRVTAKEPQNHRHVRYSYTVEGQTYNKIGMAERGNASFEKIQIGDPFTVYYNPSDPSSSVSGYPDYSLQDSIFGTGLMVVVVPLFATISLYVKGYFKPRNAVEQINGREGETATFNEYQKRGLLTLINYGKRVENDPFWNCLLIVSRKMSK